MSRYVVLDTETTGLSPEAGDRVFEIGCIEITNTLLIERKFHAYLNPEKRLSDESKKICKIEDDSFLINKPKFSETVKEFINFLKFDKDGNEDLAIIVAHNVAFDIKFINMELDKVGYKNLNNYRTVDTVKLAKYINPGKPANLDYICNNYNIDLSIRETKGHGALIDAELLAQVFLKLIEGQDENYPLGFNKDSIDFVGIQKRIDPLLDRKMISLSEDEIRQHNLLLETIKAI